MRAPKSDRDIFNTIGTSFGLFGGGGDYLEGNILSFRYFCRIVTILSHDLNMPTHGNGKLHLLFERERERRDSLIIVGTKATSEQLGQTERYHWRLHCRSRMNMFAMSGGTN